MGALTDLLKSERGLFALVLAIASTVLTALGHMTIDAWKDFNLYVFGIYVGGKTITGAVGMFTGTGATEPSLAPAEAAKAVEPAKPAEPAAEPAK